MSPCRIDQVDLRLKPGDCPDRVPAQHSGWTRNAMPAARRSATRNGESTDLRELGVI
jgi:hypothetical protein